MRYIVTLFLLLLSVNFVFAVEQGYFVSLKSNNVNAREGPGKEHPIIFRFIQKHQPLKVIREFEGWLLIEDIEKDRGWIYSNLVSNQKYVTVTGKEVLNLYNSCSLQSRIIAKVSPKVICKLIGCQEKLCNIKCNSYKGWLDKEYLWGIE